MKRNVRARAFTLIELLTVVAIIGILAGILIPVTAGVRRKARDASCLSNLRQFGNALHLYAADHRDRFPILNYSSSGETKEGGIALGRYLFPNITNDATLNSTVTTKMTCWVKTPGDPTHSWGYGFTTYLSYWSGNSSYGVPCSTVTDPANHIYACCMANGGRWIDHNVLGTKYGDLRQAVPKPHNGRVGWLFVDGHAKFEKASKIPRAQITRHSPYPSGSYSYKASDETTYVGDPAWDK
ncbi:MAG: type II secretion system GspH family protein [Opitutaceae bacterium]|jgi:prepilin-type N-terminal cleavage/methylation domain-containing protein/prepilin-type processing-associated H-X9-DG protein|nr:type II secretion system GspH family protein [Opitutaceae bacterium]